MRELSLRLTDGSTLVLPATLASATTYTILEQERWFEKEVDFLQHWLKPGMTVLDIGSNLGVYAVPCARRVAPAPVYAFEPASDPRSFLERSRDANGAANLRIIAAALSDRPRDGHLVFGNTSELNRLGEDGAGERVAVSSLDHEDTTRGWPPPDFVKLDAEGEEERILEGGRNFFARYSPLVMFEMRQAEKVNEPLIAHFRELGYGIYRALPSLPLLLPHDAGEEIDGYELNLFAAKADRARELAAQGFLLESLPQWSADSAALARATDVLKQQIFAPAFAPLLSAPLHPSYRAALAGYAAWRTDAIPLPERCAALRFACESLLKVCEQAPTIARLSSLARIAWEWGRRSVTVVALQALASSLQRRPRLEEPFWPASPRFDAIAPQASWNDWFLASAMELYERSKNLSSYYGVSGVDLDWLCRQVWATAELERRRVLQARRNGIAVAIPERLRHETPDHVNADLWRADRIPNSL